ncbi:MAG: penicillin-binding protein 2 [bacterium]|nr:penicillin-binding protein 2 [bacterium]
MEGFQWEQRFRRRIGYVAGVLASLALAVVGKQASLQLFNYGQYAERAAGQQISYVTVRSNRGDIQDRYGKPLATSSEWKSIAVRPWQVKQPELVAEKLSEALHIDKDNLLQRIRNEKTFFYVKRVASDTERSQLQQWRQEYIDREKERDPDYEGDPLEGVEIDVESIGKRFYPQGRVASHVLGFVSDDERGLEGVEASYNEELAGVIGAERHRIDVANNSVASEPVLLTKAIPGKHVQLTIDTVIQYTAEAALRKAVAYRHAKGGICLVMDAHTGEILASAVAPDYEPTHFEKADKKVRRNRAITDAYEPGSVFKTFTAAAALKNGASPNTVYSCPSTMTIDGCTIGNASDGLYTKGTETLADIIRYSFNTGTAYVAMELGREKLAKTFYDFGFGEATGVGLQGEADGILGDWRDWSNIDTCTRSYGQAATATPVQLCSGMQAIANGGVRMQPRLIKAIVDDDGNVVENFPVQEVARPISSANARDLTEILCGVVASGTGKPGAVPGYKVAGKTGTADVVDEERGGYAQGRHNSSFLGFAPADDPRIVVLVKLEDPTPIYFGGTVAGPVFKEVCSKVLPYLGVSPTAGYDQVEVK